MPDTALRGFDARASGWLADAGPLREALKSSGLTPSKADLAMDRLYNLVRQLEVQKRAAANFDPASKEYAVMHRLIGRNLAVVAERYKLSPEQMYPEAIRRTYLGS